MLRRLATASRKLVVEAIVLVVLFCLVVVVEVNVRDVRRGSLEEMVLVKRGGGFKDFCR